MTPISRRTALFAPLLAAPAVGCFPTEKRDRFRLTVQVLVGGRSVTASSVMENGFTEAVTWWTGATPQLRYRGEATLLDLGGGRILAALMRDWMRPTSGPAYLQRSTGWTDHRHLPVFALFEDRMRAASLRVLPQDLSGQDVFTLVSATTQPTSDRLFTGTPERVFPWLLSSFETPYSLLGPKDWRNEPSPPLESWITPYDILCRKMRL